MTMCSGAAFGQRRGRCAGSQCRRSDWHLWARRGEELQDRGQKPRPAIDRALKVWRWWRWKSRCARSGRRAGRRTSCRRLTRRSRRAARRFTNSTARPATPPSSPMIRTAGRRLHRRDRRRRHRPADVRNLATARAPTGILQGAISPGEHYGAEASVLALLGDLVKRSLSAQAPAGIAALARRKAARHERDSKQGNFTQSTPQNPTAALLSYKARPLNWNLGGLAVSAQLARSRRFMTCCVRRLRGPNALPSAAGSTIPRRSATSARARCRGCTTRKDGQSQQRPRVRNGALRRRSLGAGGISQDPVIRSAESIASSFPSRNRSEETRSVWRPPERPCGRGRTTR